MSEGEFAKKQLNELYERHPELFSSEFDQGYGFTEPSRKQQVRCRWIRLTASGVVFTVAPAFVRPYMSVVVVVAEAGKVLFLMRFYVPCWAIA